MVLLKSKQKLCVSTDWLSFSGQLILERGENPIDPAIECPYGYRLELLSGTNVFRFRAILYDHRGRKVITALWSPYSKKINQRLINFEIANFWLYSDKLQEVINLTYNIHNYTFLCFTRLDICCDFEKSVRQGKIIDNLFRHRYYVAAKQEGSGFWHKGIVTNDTHDMNWGSKKSDIKWKLYDKSRELRIESKNPQKPYIWQQWADFGMNITNVWRLEVSITNLRSIKVAGYFIDFDMYFMPDFVVTFFGEMVKQRFIIRKDERHTRKSNDTEVKLLAYPYSGIKVSTRHSKGTHQEQSAATQLLKLLDVLESPQVMQDVSLFDMIERSISQLMFKYKLNKYFMMVKEDPYRVYIRRLRANIGQGVYEGNLTSTPVFGNEE